MDATGIICEYNPLHLGHKKQIDVIKQQYPNTGIVCLMSGNYVQRGAPAIVDKSLRAQAAILCGADLVLELPVTAALSSAEGFAREGVRILGSFCTRLCFGAETANESELMSLASALLSPDFSAALRTQLDKGLSFPAARQAALVSLGQSADALSLPNNILGVEYCKAIMQLESSMRPMPIIRQGHYHAENADVENPSATAVRALLLQTDAWHEFLPATTIPLMENAALHTLDAGERAILSRLRTMRDEEFKSLPYSSEGLWRKLMRNARTCSSLEEIIHATKSKRYTRTRLDRMVMCAFLGLTAQDLSTPAPYARVLAFNDTGRKLLKFARQNYSLPNIGESMDHPYQQIESRTGLLYSLFAQDCEPLTKEEYRRVNFLSMT